MRLDTNTEPIERVTEIDDVTDRDDIVRNDRVDSSIEPVPSAVHTENHQDIERSQAGEVALPVSTPDPDISMNNRNIGPYRLRVQPKRKQFR